MIKKAFIDFLNREKKHYLDRELDEQTVPSYTHAFSPVRFVFWQRIFTVARLASNTPFSSVLDFGSGTGILLPFIQEINRQSSMYAFDIDKNSLNILRKTKKEFSLDNLSILSREQLDSIKHGSIDVVTALDVLEHIEDLHSTSLFFNGILAKNGKLIVSCPTESFLYKSMRIFGGKAYHGRTHHYNADDVDKVLSSVFIKTKEVKLYFPFVFFKIIQYAKR